MDDGRDAEPRLLDEEALHGVRERRALARAEDRGATDARHVPDAVREQLARRGDVEGAVVQESARPHAPDLGELLVEGHALDQVVEAPGRRNGGVAVRLVSGGRRHRDGS